MSQNAQTSKAKDPDRAIVWCVALVVAVLVVHATVHAVVRPVIVD